MANLAKTDSYNRLSVIQPASHPTHPWPALIFGIFSVSIWYNVLNQFMIQRVLAQGTAIMHGWESSSPGS